MYAKLVERQDAAGSAVLKGPAYKQVRGRPSVGRPVPAPPAPPTGGKRARARVDCRDLAAGRRAHLTGPTLWASS